MGKAGAIDREPAVYAHHVRALRARRDREDDEAVGGRRTRGRFRDQHAEDRGDRKARQRKPAYGRVDWFAPSPLTGRDRQSGGFRVPHVDFKAITPTIAPTSRDGERRARKPTEMMAAEHCDYVTDGAKIGIASHIDYIGRATGLDNPLGGLAMDALDELAERNEMNALGRYTNIPGGWERARSLFEAGERAVPAPKTYELLASTSDWETFAYARRLASSPEWVRRVEGAAPGRA